MPSYAPLINRKSPRGGQPDGKRAAVPYARRKSVNPRVDDYTAKWVCESRGIAGTCLVGFVGRGDHLAHVEVILVPLGIVRSILLGNRVTRNAATGEFARAHRDAARRD